MCDTIYGCTKAGVETVKGVMKQVMRPIKYGVGKMNEFSENRVKDMGWASKTGIDTVHDAAKKVDDKCMDVAGKCFDEFKWLVESGFEGVGQGFKNSRGEIPTPFELLMPCCRNY